MKTRIHIPLLLSIVVLCLGGTLPSPLQQADIQEGLEALTRRGFTYRMLSNDLIELTDPVSGVKQIKSLHRQDESEIRTWAASRGIPILEINPSLIDTSQFLGWYQFWARVPLSNGFEIPLLVGDVDQNGKPEVYGNYKDFSTNVASRIYEISQGGGITLRHDYIPRRGFSTQFTDIDGDSLAEVIWEFGDTTFVYEQSSSTGLPVVPSLDYVRGLSILNFNRATNLDSDSLVDYLYQGRITDSAGTRTGTYVAEYNPSAGNLQRVWGAEFPPWSSTQVAGFITGDFDGDGRSEFVSSGGSGGVYIMENDGDNSYSPTWEYSTPFPNLYYLTSGDVDNDGRDEFFVGATLSNGNWTTVFEADSNDSYSPRFLFHLLSGGTLDRPTYLASDIDGDKTMELIILSGSDLFVFKSSSDNSYYLWYYRKITWKNSVQVYNFFGEGVKSLLVSRDTIDGQGRLRLYCDILRPGPAVSVRSGQSEAPMRIELLQNYPNPFNPQTEIRYSIDQTGTVRLVVHDMLGREITVLVDGRKQAGSYTVGWNATDFASGVYFYRITTESGSLTRKMLLLK